MNETPLRILGIGAHPDDLEILCGGTLARYRRQGHQVVMAHLVNGDKGHYEMPSDQLATIRSREAIEAAEAIGAEAVGLDIPDAELVADLDTRRRVIDLIRRVRPDIIITHAPNDYVSDHTAASKLACDASFYCSAPLLKTDHPATDGIPPVFFMDTVAGMAFQPTAYVDISDTFAEKKAMVARHKSQLDWLREHDEMDALEFMATVARFRGLQCGVRYAEGFRQYNVWPRNTTKRWLP